MSLFSLLTKYNYLFFIVFFACIYYWSHVQNKNLNKREKHLYERIIYFSFVLITLSTCFIGLLTHDLSHNNKWTNFSFFQILPSFIFSGLFIHMFYLFYYRENNWKTMILHHFVVSLTVILADYQKLGFHSSLFQLFFGELSFVSYPLRTIYFQLNKPMPFSKNFLDKFNLISIVSTRLFLMPAYIFVYLYYYHPWTNIDKFLFFLFCIILILGWYWTYQFFKNKSRRKK